jgi:hypothetical protein
MMTPADCGASENAAIPAARANKMRRCAALQREPGGEDGDDESVPLPSAAGDQPGVSAATDLKRRRVTKTEDAPCKVEPTGLVDLLGRAICHKIPGYGWHAGRVHSRADNKAREFYVVVYNDGDEVTLTRAQVEKYCVAETAVKAEIVPRAHDQRHAAESLQCPSDIAAGRGRTEPAAAGTRAATAAKLATAATAVTAHMHAAAGVSANAPAPRADAVLPPAVGDRVECNFPVETGGKGWEPGTVTRVVANTFFVQYDGFEDEDSTRVDINTSVWRLAPPPPAAAVRSQPEPAAAAVAATAAATATLGADPDPMRVIKDEQESALVGKVCWPYLPGSGQRFMGRVGRRLPDAELAADEDGAHTAFFEVVFDCDGGAVRASASDLRLGARMLPPQLVQGQDKRTQGLFDAATIGTLRSTANKKVLADRFMFTNTALMAVLGGNGQETFRYPAAGATVQHRADFIVTAQPDWNPLLPKHAGADGVMMLDPEHDLVGERAVSVFVCRGPSNAAKEFSTTRKWEYCGEYAVPPVDADTLAMLDQVEFVTMGPHTACPHCQQLHSLSNLAAVKELKQRLNRVPNETMAVRCPTTDREFTTVLVEPGFPIDAQLHGADAQDLLPDHSVYCLPQVDGGHEAQEKYISVGSSAKTWGLSRWLDDQPAAVQAAFPPGAVAARREQYFGLLACGAVRMEQVPFKFRAYDERLYDLLCAAEAEWQLDPRHGSDARYRSAAARPGDAQAEALVGVYRDLRASLVARGGDLYRDGKYTPPKLLVARAIDDGNTTGQSITLPDRAMGSENNGP